MRNDTTVFVGLDVHKESIVAAYAIGAGEVQDLGNIGVLQRADRWASISLGFAVGMVSFNGRRSAGHWPSCMGWHVLHSGSACGQRRAAVHQRGVPLDRLMMIEKALAYELGGAAGVDFRPGGIVCTIEAVLVPKVQPQS